MNDFNDIINDSEYFIDLPDCISDGGSYKESIEKAMRLVNDGYDVDEFSWEANGPVYKLSFRTKHKHVGFDVSIMSDYIDGKNLCIGLDKILSETGYLGNKRFVAISGETVDFAIAFITSEKDQELRNNGLNYN